MKYLAASLYLPTYLFRGSPNHVNYDWSPGQNEHCQYKTGSSQQVDSPIGTLWQTFEICSCSGSNDPLHLDNLSLEVQIESFKYTRYIQGIQADGPQIFHPDASGLITDSAAENFPINMAIKLTHTILDNSLELNDIPRMYTGPVMYTAHIRLLHFSPLPPPLNKMPWQAG